MARFKSLSIVFLGIAFAMPLANASAVENSCILEQAFDTLRAVQNQKFSNNADAESTELAARKTFLHAVIDCARKETETLKSSIAAVDAGSQGAKATKERFVSKFDEALGYYNVQKSRINDLGLEGTKELSRNLKEWRSVTYDPLSRQAANFIIWTKNRSLLENAKNRFGQISRTLELLKLSDNETIHALLQKADADLRSANEADSRTRGALERFDAPETSSASIKDTLNSLAAAYQDFFDIADALQKK